MVGEKDLLGVKREEPTPRHLTGRCRWLGRTSEAAENRREVERKNGMFVDKYCPNLAHLLPSNLCDALRGK